MGNLEHVARHGVMGGEDSHCFTCEESESWRCNQSKRPCGHHCNHFWTHDQCCRCEECADMATEDMLDTAEGEDE